MIGSARVGLAILLVLPAVPREALCQIEFVLVNNSPEVREGLNQAESDANELPPDCSKAVGDGVLITTTNRTISVYDLDNLANAPDTLSLAEFFPFMPDLEPADDVFDARTIYDNHSGRFVVSAIGPSLQGGAGTKFLHVAYSNGDGVELPDEMSPGDWFFSSINGRELDFNCDGNSQNLGVDVPTLGYDHRAWYVSSPLIGSPLQAFKTSGVIYIVHK